MDSVLALPWWGIAWVAGVMLLAGFAHGAIGFGFPLVATPMLTLVLDIKTTILVLLVPSMVMTLISAFRGVMLRDSVGRFWFMPVTLVIGSYFGTRLLIGANPAHFVLLLAVLPTDSRCCNEKYIYYISGVSICTFVLVKQVN